MAKQRIQTRYAKNQVRLTPQANPVNTFVQPSRDNQLSKALDSLVGSVSRKNAKDSQAQDQANATAFKIQQIQAAEAAYAGGDWASVKDNFSLADNPNYGPLLQITYNQKIGTEDGLHIQNELFKWDSENSHLRDSDPVAYNEALDTKTLELLKGKLTPNTVDAVGYASHMRNQVAAASNQLKSQQAAEYRTAQAALPLDNFLTQLGANVNTAEIAAVNNPNERMNLVGEAVRTSLQTAINTKLLTNKELNGATTDYLITLATEKKDLSILNVAKTISTGHGGYLWGIHTEKKKLVAAQRAIASQLDNDEYSAYQKKQRATSEAKTSYQESAYAYYLENRTFEGFEEGSDLLGDYEANRIQERVKEFKETPLLTQEDYSKYYTLFSSVTELTGDRAREMLEGMDINSQGEWQLAEAAMGDVLNKRTSVYNSDPYKQASDFIANKFKIDPQSKTSLANINAASLMEYQRSVQDLKRMATSYIVNQTALDKGLKDINADESYLGRSLHLLPETVKYDLFMHNANNAYSTYSTTLDSKVQNATSPSGSPAAGTVTTINGIPITVTQKPAGSR